MTKWVALAMIVAGIVAILKAMNMDSTSSFEDGSFLGQISLFVIGAVLGIGGIGTIAVLAFRHL